MKMNYFVIGINNMAAGPRLLEECRKIKPASGIRCATGEARITLSGDSQSRFVIHSAGSRYNQEKILVNY